MEVQVKYIKIILEYIPPFFSSVIFNALCVFLEFKTFIHLNNMKHLG